MRDAGSRTALQSGRMSLAPRPARLFVIALLAAVAVCGALSIEAWPLTGWRLFSRERHQLASGWAATSVDAQGRQTPIPFDSFPASSSRFVNVMSGFARLSPAEREATCQTWARLVRERSGDTTGGLRLYSTIRDLREHIGRSQPVEPVRTLRWACADGRGARRAEPAPAGARP